MAELNKNKVIYGENVLIDLTGDSVTPADLAKGVTAHDKSGAQITGTSTKDADTSDATGTVAEMLEGKTAYVGGKKVTGTMPNRGAATIKIARADTPVAIPRGYHDGSGKATLDETEQAKLVAKNIRQGISLFGVEGSMSSTEGMKAQSKAVTPKITKQTILPDETYNALSQVEVAAIPYSEAENNAGGLTVTIGA